MSKRAKNIDFALRQLLLEGDVGTHEEIAHALTKQGFAINQPKISRLLHKIGAIKVTGANGQNIYRLPHEHGLMHELTRPTIKLSANQLILSIDNNHAMIVIHTLPGAANIVAREIDLHRINLGILGSIAGDDTIFIAPKDLKVVKQTIEKIKTVLEC